MMKRFIRLLKDKDMPQRCHDIEPGEINCVKGHVAMLCAFNHDSYSLNAGICDCLNADTGVRTLQCRGGKDAKT